MNSVVFSEAEVLALVNSTSDMVWIVSSDYCLRLANRSFLDSIKARSGVEIAPGDPLLVPRVYSEPLIELWRGLFDRVLGGESIVQDVQISGSSTIEDSWLELRLNPIGAPSAIVGIACFGKDISHRTRDEERFVASEERYGNLVENLPDLITEVDINGAFTFVNRASIEFFGLEPVDCIGRSAFDFVVSADRATTLAAFQSWVSGTAKHLSFTNRQVSAKGGTREVLWNIARLSRPDGSLDGFLSIGRDVTDFLAKERELVHAQAKFQGIVDSAMDAIVTIDEQQRIVMFNKAAERMFGYSFAELQGHSLDLLLPPDKRKVHRHHVAEFGRSGVTTRDMGHLLETSGVRSNGEAFPIEVSIAQFKDSESTFFHAVVRDISERRKTERWQAELTQRLSETQKLEALGGLASGVAHDMNNILAAISSIATVRLQREPSETATHRAFETIVQAVSRGSEMVKGLLKFVRKESPTRALVDWNALIGEQVKLMGHLVLSRVQIEVELAPNLPAIVGDPAELGNVLMNLCVNSIDAMAHVDGDRVLTIRTRFDKKCVSVEVVDNGVGMSEETRKRALEPFFTTKETGLGTGLGLYLAASIINAHSGELTLESTLGVGTRVHLIFPVSDEHVSPKKEMDMHSLGPGRRQVGVLVVDDDPMVRESFAELLTLLGCVVTATDSGEAALEVLAERRDFDGVFLDMNMPGMGGPATLIAIRAEVPNLPVVVTTGLADQSVLELADRTPHTKVLTKPISLVDLRERLAALGTP